MFAVLAIVATSCRVDAGAVASATGDAPAAALPPTVEGESTAGLLPDVGPIPGASHWHAAYVVRICNDVLAPFDSTDDPLGIHSHSDGVMHVHPFFEESGYEAATVGLFADAMGLELGDGELTLPGGGTWRDGDLCDGEPGRVFVDRWTGPSPESDVERIFSNPADVRFLADGELYQIAFAPVDSPPVVPPSASFLSELSNLDVSIVDPWVKVDTATTLDQVSVWPIADASAAPCSAGFVPERVESGPSSCFAPDGEGLSGAQAIEGARAVRFNRRPAVELAVSSDLRRLMRDHFVVSDSPLALAIEIDGWVITAPTVARLPVSEDRLVISGGFTDETARQLARVLAGS